MDSEIPIAGPVFGRSRDRHVHDRANQTRGVSIEYERMVLNLQSISNPDLTQALSDKVGGTAEAGKVAGEDQPSLRLKARDFNDPPKKTLNL
jgi:hypothetical protein